MEIEEILKRQDVKALKEAINHGVDISKVKSIDFIFEVKEIDFTFLKILIDNGININEKDEIGYLLFSCIFGENEEEKTIIRDEAFLKYFIEFIMKNNNIEKDFFEEILEEITLLGKIEIIQIMVDNGFDINYDFDGISLLAFTCMFSDIKLVELYLAYGADVKKTFIIGEVSVNILMVSLMASQIMKTNKMQKLIIDKQKQHKMIKENSPIILKLLIQEGANVNFTDSNNLSILMHACLFSDIEMIEILIQNGADVNHNYGNMSLLGFILLLTKKVFEQIMFNKNFGKLDEDKVFFHFNENRMEIAQLLIDNGAKITNELWFMSLLDKKIVNNLTTSKSIIEKEFIKSSINMMNFGNIEIIKFLIKNGVDINVDINMKYDKQTTALEVAFLQNNYKIFKLLVENGADVNLLDELYLPTIKNKDILQIIINNINIEKFNKLTQSNNKMAKSLNIMRLLTKELESVKEKEKPSRKFQTPIAKVILSKNSSLLKDLIDEGYDVSSISICDLIKENYPFDFISLIVKNGADVNEIEPKNGYTPLIEATRYNDIDLIKLLIAYGAKVDYKTKKGKEAYNFASDLEVIKILLNPLEYQNKEHNPKKLINILTNFTIDTPIKYTTHLWDFGNIKKEYGDFQGFIKAISTQWKELEIELKALSPNLHNKIYNFLLNNSIDESWCSRTDINIGWSSLDGLEDWCNEGNNPFEFKLPNSYEVDGKTITTFGEIINLFKREIEIRNENNMLESIFLEHQKKLGRKFSIELIKLKGRTFYTDVEKFRDSINRIFEEIKKRDKDYEIVVEVVEADSESIELKITQLNSFSNRSAKEMLEEVEDGDFKILKENLLNLCDWSIESRNEQESYRVNYLKSSNINEIEKLSNDIDGFTHILRFYKK